MQAMKKNYIQRQVTFYFAHVAHLVKCDRAIIGIKTKKRYISTTHMEVILAKGP